MKLKYMNMDEKNYWALIALYKCLKVSHVDCIDSILFLPGSGVGP